MRGVYFFVVEIDPFMHHIHHVATLDNEATASGILLQGAMSMLAGWGADPRRRVAVNNDSRKPRRQPGDKFFKQGAQRRLGVEPPRHAAVLEPCPQAASPQQSKMPIRIAA